jgi:hypothetical protein
MGQNNVHERRERVQSEYLRWVEELAKRIIFINKEYKTARGFVQAVNRLIGQVVKGTVIAYKGKKPYFIFDDWIFAKPDQINRYVEELLVDIMKDYGFDPKEVLENYLKGNLDEVVKNELSKILLLSNRDYPCRSTTNALKVVWTLLEGILENYEKFHMVWFKVIKIDEEAKRILLKGYPMNIFILIEFKNKPPPAFLNTRYFDKYGVTKIDDYLILNRGDTGEEIAYQFAFLLTHPNIERVWIAYGLGLPEYKKKVMLCSIYVIHNHWAKSVDYKLADWNMYFNDTLQKLKRYYRL